MKRLLLILLVVVMGISMYTYFSGSQEGGRRGDQEVQVEVIPVQRQTLYDNVEVLGNAYANESVEITANVLEIIDNIEFEDGVMVRQGNIIAVLDHEEESAQLQAARAQLEEHERELKRLEGLLKQNITAERNYEERKTMLEVTQASIGEIKATIGDRIMRAPFDGMLGIRQVSRGSLVQPGDVIAILDDISRIKLDFNVPAIYLPYLKPGVPITATSEIFPGETFTGKIETVNSRVDPVTRSILVRAILPNPDGHLLPGMLLQVTVLKNKREAWVVPEESITQQQDKHFVMVVGEDNMVEKRQIQIGVHEAGVIEVVDGLQDGERVVVRGVHKMRPGQAVAVSKTWETLRKPDTGGLKGE